MHAQQKPSQNLDDTDNPAVGHGEGEALRENLK
jgi:hypothetical protein